MKFTNSEWNFLQIYTAITLKVEMRVLSTSGKLCEN